MFGFLVSVFVSIWNPGYVHPSDTTSNAYDSTRLVVIDDVFVVGNNRTNEAIIFREMEIKVGEVLRYDNLEILKKSDRERIYNTRLFNAVDIVVIDQSYDRIDIIVTVAERWYTFPAPILELVDRNFNDWWVNENHDLSRINYGIKLYQLNMRGRNETLKLTAQLGFTRKFALAYEIPYIDKSQRNGLEMGFAYTENNNISVKTVGHKRDFFQEEKSILTQTSLNMTYRLRPTFYDYHFFEMGFRNAVVSDTVINLNENYFSDAKLEQRILSIAYGYRKDLRDVIAYPLRGSKFDISLRKSGLGIFNDVDFWTFYISFSKYLNLKRGYYLANHTASYANTTKKISYNNYYGLGYNVHFVRGYELYLVEGPSFFLNKTSFKKLIFSRVANMKMVPIEQFRKLPIQIYLKGYFDFGYVNNYANYTPNTLLSNRMLYGTGIGLDFVTWYDVVIRTEYSFNHLKETGFLFILRRNFKTDYLHFVIGLGPFKKATGNYILYYSNIKYNKMNKYLLLACLLLPQYSFCQFKSSYVPSTSIGRGGAGITKEEPENIFINPAATQADTSHHLLMGFNVSAGFPGVSEISFAYLNNRKKWAWGLDVYRYGNRDFSNQYLGFSLIQRRGIATLALKFKYIQTGSTELVVFHLFEWDLGSHVNLSESLEVGLLATNLNRSLLKGSFSEYIPLVLIAGIHYKYNSKLSFYSELSKTEGYEHRLSMGWEYRFQKKLVLRSGVSATPPRVQFGLSVGLSQIRFSYGMFTQAVFGTTHAWNLDYSY